eukprot:580788_1
MEQLVRFRMLSSTLTLDEYRALLSTVLNENTMEEFSSMIFSHCLKQLQTQNGRNGLQIDTINQEITDIVSERKLNQTSDNSFAQDDATDNESEPLTIIGCGNNLIQEIASYLPFKSYSNFQSCCRSIFYAANSPSSLYELHWNRDFQKRLDGHNKHQLQSFMKRFERVQKLYLYDQYSLKTKYISMTRFTNLKHLAIEDSVNGINKYLSENILHWDIITHLDLCNCDDALILIKRCKNLRSLGIAYFPSDVYFPPGSGDKVTSNQQALDFECLSNLYALELGCYVYIDTRIVPKNICTTLQALTFYPKQHNLDGLAFDNLVELGLRMASSNDILSTIKRTKRLKCLQLFKPSFSRETDTSFGLAFEKILELSALEYCYVELDERCFWPFIFCIDSIESALINKKDILKLEIDIKYVELLSHKIYEAIVTIWKVFSCYARHFMLIFVFKKGKHTAVTESLNQWLNSTPNTLFVDTKTAGMVVVSNKLSARVFNEYSHQSHQTWVANTIDILGP